MINTELLFDPSIYIMAHSCLFDEECLPLSCKTYSKGAIYPNSVEKNKHPGGLFDKQDHYIINTSWVGSYKPSSCLEQAVDYIDEDVVFIGQLHKCWGHFITDSLSRLWYMLDDKCQRHKAVYIGQGGFKMDGNYKRLFELLNIDVENIIEIKKPTMFRNVILPDRSFKLVGKYDDQKRVFTKEYKTTIELLKSNCVCENKHSKKLYFTSRSFKRTRREFGEEKIEAYLKTKGFEIISPEAYSLDEQISMIKNCDCFASTDGSAGHNVIFCSNNAKAIIIPKGPYRSGYQDTLNQVNQIDVFYIDSSLSVLADKNHPHHGPFYFYVSEELLSFFGDSVQNIKKYLKHNFYDLKHYFRYGLSLNKNYLISTKHGEKLFHYLFMIESLSFSCRAKQKFKRLFKKRSSNEQKN